MGVLWGYRGGRVPLGGRARCGVAVDLRFVGDWLFFLRFLMFCRFFFSSFFFRYFDVGFTPCDIRKQE